MLSRMAFFAAAHVIQRRDAAEPRHVAATLFAASFAYMGRHA